MLSVLFLKVPSGQATQSVPFRNCEREHPAVELEPGHALLPGATAPAHGSQDAMPGSAWKKPTGHALHAAEPVALPNVPGTQSKQVVLPSIAANLPSGHS